MNTSSLSNGDMARADIGAGAGVGAALKQSVAKVERSLAHRGLCVCVGGVNSQLLKSKPPQQPTPPPPPMIGRHAW